MKGKGSAVPLPDWEPEEIEDYYTLYVQIMGLSENAFWYSDLGFVKAVAANKQAFEKWMNRQIEAKRRKK